jgi:hypothetical protein
MSDDENNARRILRAQTILDVYAQLNGPDEYESSITDLVTDLRHFVDDASLDWEYIDRVSAMHHDAEKTEVT